MFGAFCWNIRDFRFENCFEIVNFILKCEIVLCLSTNRFVKYKESSCISSSSRFEKYGCSAVGNVEGIMFARNYLVCHGCLGHLLSQDIPGTHLVHGLFVMGLDLLCSAS